MNTSAVRLRRASSALTEEMDTRDEQPVSQVALNRRYTFRQLEDVVWPVGADRERDRLQMSRHYSLIAIFEERLDIHITAELWFSR